MLLYSLVLSFKFSIKLTKCDSCKADLIVLWTKVNRAVDKGCKLLFHPNIALITF